MAVQKKKVNIYVNHIVKGNTFLGSDEEIIDMDLCVRVDR